MVFNLNPLPFDDSQPRVDRDLELLRFILAWTEGRPGAAPAEIEQLPEETQALLISGDRSSLLRVAIEALNGLRDDDEPVPFERAMFN